MRVTPRLSASCLSRTMSFVSRWSFSESDQHTGEIEADLASTRLPQRCKPLLPTCDVLVISMQ